ncbi:MULTISPECIES: hypothetical protein [Pontibacillus]|uniref:Uncharacterized protein n=1 Tax=Pontibacillus chungwhensis TaxID=265426 RepID=A0ABY8UYZ7_9BACI|nr:MULTISPECIES: hypothetical protein [Pontibacillus]MCD5324745.1 hypothetical protein [Pontibacillus sp. HN14]WIF98704.1 hypothetical protein QNI29_03370 [Pontibacillus chungwhensis]
MKIVLNEEQTQKFFQALYPSAVRIAAEKRKREREQEEQESTSNTSEKSAS